ncbi:MULTISPECIES: flagellar basal-body rod protein FlgG [Rhodanobacter]|uniref:flagellar basal-body rod protein FlgG n=1 Tax=Rhodanobacter TaxID=75309 RepID=UPI000260E622|nr:MULTISPECIES: flagellar basal-body rod protein FlgG [Rhodanobacter]EIM01786.1 flagellar basal-body rod protein FlgG [Rhodanobacter denitrificans]KZC21355.1 flagellar basal-body rod protein FlgG [Rhodanobacter denitrificans]UJJ50198.1 flagellar basal-body rod protein FlgG [Rhodanobacter denitrificans]UJM91481.1 flagellar basal-body rod protein FlgG [Rhodanobacter denitrificans]UJM92913.1 flagellar basal-body rod protein FlgG [Rhodanobacter denitrificans]
MFSSLWVAKTGLDAQQTRMDVISNNLANANTTGYKSARASFQDLVYQNLRQPGGQTTEQTQAPSGLMLGTGVRVAGSEKLFTQGNIEQTGNSLDVAVQGRGFLQVTMPDGSIAYTRDGSLHMDQNGQIVTANGYAVDPAISVPANAQSITIGSDGTISVSVPGQAATQQIGTVQLADFINPAGLQPNGDNLYLETASSGSPQIGQPGLNGLGTLAQGALESSNVNVVEQMVNMIETQRTYEMNSKAVSAADSMLQFLTNKT